MSDAVEEAADPEAETVSGPDKAVELYTPKYREGFSVPKIV